MGGKNSKAIAFKRKLDMRRVLINVHGFLGYVSLSETVELFKVFYVPFSIKSKESAWLTGEAKKFLLIV